MELVAWDGGEGGGGGCCSGRGEAPAEKSARRSCDAHGRRESAATGRGSRGEEVYRIVQFVELYREASRGRSVSAVVERCRSLAHIQARGFFWNLN